MTCGTAGVDAWESLLSTLNDASFWTMATRENVWRPGTLHWTVDACVDGAYHSVSTYPKDDRKLERAVSAIRAILLK